MTISGSTPTNENVPTFKRKAAKKAALRDTYYIDQAKARGADLKARKQAQRDHNKSLREARKRP
jgi:hypothetical protein